MSIFPSRKISLNSKFVIYTTALMLVLAGVVSFLIVNHERYFLVEQLKQRAISIVKSTANNCSYGVFVKRKSILDGFVVSAIIEKDVNYVAITDRHGIILSCSRNDLVGVVDKAIRTESLKELTIYKKNNKEFDIQIPVKILIPDDAKKNVKELFLSTGQREREKNIIGFVRLVINTQDISRVLNVVGKKIFFITLLLIIVSLGLSAYFMKRIITNPLQDLVNLAQKVSHGELNYKANINSLDEIGELAFAFNKMTEDLKKSRGEIEEYNRTLEDKVNKRTEELKEANELLKKTQVELVQSAKMTAIGQLGAGVAHELNNPLGGVLGYSQYILQKMASPNFSAEDFNTCRKYVGYIEKETKRCQGIVENLLGFSRKSLEISQTNLKKVLDDSLAILHHQLIIKAIEVDLKVEDDLACVEGNANQLQQVFMNIILNAQQAMPNGGDLTISARNICDNTGKPVQIEIRFKDTGCGIAEENIDKIFDPFFTTKREWKGTGLGLSVTYQIIMAHRGRISVDSKEGQGSVFTITLPALNK